MTKKGFTLIELLAVIVILAIISVIATPIIIGIVEGTRKDAFNRSIEMILSSTNLDLSVKENSENYTYTIDNGNINDMDVPIKNIENFSGTIVYDDNKIKEYAIHNGKYCIVKRYNEDSATINEYKGTCLASTDEKCFTYEINTKNEWKLTDRRLCENFFVEYLETNDYNGYNPVKIAAYLVCDNASTDYLTDTKMTLFEYLNTEAGLSLVQPLSVLNIVKNNPSYKYEMLDKDACKTFMLSMGLPEDLTILYCENENFTFLDYINVSKEVATKNSEYWSFQDMFDLGVLKLNESNKYEFTSIESCVSYLNDYQNFGINMNNHYCNGGTYMPKFTDLLSMYPENSEGYAMVSALLENEIIAAEQNYKAKITGYDDTCEKDVVIPEKIDENLVTVIAEKAFRNKNLTSVALPYNITMVSNSAFADNNISGELDLSYLDDLYLLSGFENNHITNIKFPKNVELIGTYAFASNELNELILPNKIFAIGLSAFTGNNIANVKIPVNIDTIYDDAFSYNNISGELDLRYLTNLEYLSGFNGNQITSIKFPQSIDYIGENAFANNKLESVIFYGKTDLNDVSIYDSNVWGWAEGYGEENIGFESINN